MKKHFPSIIFFIVLIVTYYCLGFSDVLDKRPQSVHAWAMCDRASVARNYAEESMNFFKPRTNFTQGGTGITGLEFPFMNYMAAICYRLFDFHEFWYRLLVLIAVTSGLVAAFHLSGHFLKNKFFSGLIVLAFFLSPVLNYYSISFLPDAASLGFILLMWLGFFNYQKKPKADPLILFFIFGALAALIKITSLISLIVILILLVFDKLKWLHTERKKIFIKHNVFIVLVLIIFILVFAWYDYARWLNDFYKCPIFLMSNNTPKTWEEAKEVWEGIKLTWIPFYYPSLIYYLILITGISLIISHRKVNRLTGTITLLLWMGNFCFVTLMFNQYRSHDYYIIALLPAVFFQFITAFEMYFRIVQKKNILLSINILMITIVLYSVFYSGKHQRWRYSFENWISSSREFNNYFYIESYLRDLGIKRESKVITMYDKSFNITLYFMNVKGWRIYDKREDLKVIEYAAAGAEYLVVNDISVLNNEKLKPFFNNKIGEFRNILIYKIKE